MKTLYYLPLAFVAGVHGFAILAPYLACCAAAHALILQRRRRAQTAPAAVGDLIPVTA
jgi:hypothetical protein